jgi:hypothetical protein
MTDDRAVFLPGQGTASIPFRSRSAYVGFRAFGSGDGAALLDPGVAHALRSAAEFATQEGRIAAGLLYGRLWADPQGGYLVVSGFLEAGPGEDDGGRLSVAGDDDFTLSPADLRLLREDAARMYPALLEVGWWRTLAELGEFGPGDFLTQLDLVGPGGAGLLVYGSGLHWGTAYLGPDGLEPDSAGTLAAAPGGDPDLDQEPGQALADSADGDSLLLEPGPEAAREPERIDLAAGESLLDDEPDGEPEPERIDLAAGESLLTDPEPEPERAGIAGGQSLAEEPLPAEDPVLTDPVLTDPELTDPELTETGPGQTGPGTAVATRRPAVLAPRPTGPRTISPVRVPAREWGVKEANPGSMAPETPTDVKIVVGGLIIAVIAAAVIIGILLSSAIIAVIAAVVFILIVLGFVWMSHL